MTLGERLKKFRNQRNLTQEEIAKKLNISYQAVSKWENDVTVPDMETLSKLSDILDVSLNDLFGKEEKTRDINKMFLKINVVSEDNKAMISVPMPVITMLISLGKLESLKINNENLKDIDFSVVEEFIKSGSIGEIIGIETDNSKIRIAVE